MSTLVIPNTFIGGTLILPTPMNNNFSAISTWANGNIDHTNLSASAGITISQLNLSSSALNLVAAGTTPTWGSGETGDSVARVTFYGDGTIGFGSGGGAAQDTFIWRSGANALTFSAADGSGATTAITVGAITSGAVTSSGALSGTNVTGTGVFTTGANGGTAGAINFKGSTSGTVSFTAPATPAAQAYTLPAAAPTQPGQMLVSTVPGILSWAGTPPRFTTTAITPTAGTSPATQTHGLGVTPVRCWAYIVCTTPQATYSIGDVVQLNGSASQTAATGIGINVFTTGANIGCVIGAQGIVILNKTTQAAVPLNAASWNLFLVAEP